MRELAYERRGKPTDRMKTEEEAAKEEKERLEKLEVNFKMEYIHVDLDF